ncbi:MAG: DUF4287 domain-containing protein [Acidobacteriota bacterium]|nr:DUF4287 domain-containing protein [Acidobacteriota bacterium]
MPRTATQTKIKSIYSPHPSLALVQKWIADLKEKTGRSLDEWMRYLKKHGPKDNMERREWLKTEHGLGTNSAWWLSDRAAGIGTEEGDPEAYLKAAEGYVEKIDTGGFARKDRITHRIEITSLEDIDDELKRWLKAAYDRDAGRKNEL